MAVTIGKESVVVPEEECSSLEELLRPLTPSEISEVIRSLSKFFNEKEFTREVPTKLVKYYYTNPDTEKETVVPILFGTSNKKEKNK